MRNTQLSEVPCPGLVSKDYGSCMLSQGHPKPRGQFPTLPATHNPVSSQCSQLTPRTELGMGHQASSSCPAEVQGQDRLCSGLGSDLCKCSHEFVGLWSVQGRGFGWGL